MTYAIFKVFDYKGGELSSSVNLSKNELISELSELFEYNLFDEDNDEDAEYDENDFNENVSLEEIKEALNKKIVEGIESTYAGGDGFCGKIYEIEGDVMTEVRITDFMEEIALELFKVFNEELD